MMYKKKKGFSLAELLISLLIISIILAAAIPTVTKRNKYDPEHIWMWSGQESNNTAYFGLGANQGAIIGYFRNPQKVTHFDGDFVSYGDDHPLKKEFTNDGDRLSLVKRYTTGSGVVQTMRNSHISFYNIIGELATESDIKYAGRIASDEYNLAFGIGSLAASNARDSEIVLQKHKNDPYFYDKTFKGYNTAVGHYAAVLNTEGQYNTALGFSALKNVQSGAYNTAVGMKALSFGSNGQGSNNTAVGFNSLLNGIDKDGNTAIGSNACSILDGNNNICIGFGANPLNPDGSEKVADDNLLVVGSFSDESSGKIVGAPLLLGHTAKTATADKELSVNALKFEVRPIDASTPVFQVVAASGIAPTTFTEGANSSLGYDTANSEKNSVVNFTLKDNMGSGKSVQMRMYADDTYNNVKLSAIDHYNAPAADGKGKYADILLNEMFEFVVPTKAGSLTDSDSYAFLNVNNLYDDTPLKEKTYLNIANAITLQPQQATNVAMKLTKENGFFVSDTNATPKSYMQLKVDGTDSYLVMSNNNSFLTMNDEGIDIYSNSVLALNSNTNQIVFGTSADAPGNAKISFKNLNSWTGADIEVAGLNSISFGTSPTTPSLVQTISNIKTWATSSFAPKTQASDIRLKNVSGDNTAGLKEINAIEVKNYTYKDDKEKTPHVGVIAQQLQKIFPNSVIKGEDGYLRIRTEEIFYAMVNSIKELFAQIQDLTAKIVGLDKRLTELEKENAMLKKQNEDFEKRLSKLEAKMAK